MPTNRMSEQPDGSHNLPALYGICAPWAQHTLAGNQTRTPPGPAALFSAPNDPPPLSNFAFRLQDGCSQYELRVI